MRGGGRDDCTDRSADPHRDGVALDDDIAHARQPVEQRRRDRARERQLHVVEGEPANLLDAVDLDEAAVADDRDAVAGPIDLIDDVRREEDRSTGLARLADEPIEGLLHQRIETRCRFVEDHQVGPVLEGDDEANLLLVTPRVLLEAAAGIELEPLDEVADVRPVDPATQVPEVVDGLPARQPVVQVEFAGQIADAAVDGDRVDRRLDAEDLGPPRRRPDQVEQNPHRGRLAGAVRAQEAEDLARGDLEIELDDAAVLAVALGQSFGLDDGRHAPPSRPTVADSPQRQPRERRASALEPRMNGSERPVKATATAVVSGTAATIPMLPTMARTISTAMTSVEAVRSGS